MFACEAALMNRGGKVEEEEEEGGMLIFWRHSQRDPACSAISAARRGLKQRAGCFVEQNVLD